MAKLTPDATRTEHGLVINEKIIPWGAVWPKDSGAYKKGAQYKADRLLSGGTGKVKGVTIHNTADLKNVEEDAEQYTRATWPNGNMNDARVHYYVDDINAWQNLREDEVGWHAGDGRKATGGNETTLSIEIIMDGTGSKEDRKAEENGVLLAALLLKKHGLSVNELYTHNHWMGHPDSIVQGARKNCPLYILPHWAQFKQKVAAKLAELNGGATTTETGKTEIMGKAKASAQQMALFARSKNAEPQLPACSLEQLAQVGVDCSKITPSFEGALIMIQMGTAMSIVPCLSTAVIPGIVKVPLLDFPPVTVEIAAMRHAPRLEVQSFIEIAKQKYAHHPDPLRMEALI